MSEVHHRNRLRVLIDGRYIMDRFPGIGRSTYSLTQALAETATAEEVLVLVRKDDANTRHNVSDLKRDGACRLVATSVPRSYLFESTMLPPLIRRLAPDVFHAPFFLRPYGLGCPCVVTIHDLIPLHRASRKAPFFDRVVFRVGARLACRQSAAILVPSRATADAVRRWLPGVSHKLVVVPHGVDPRFSRRGPAEVQALRERLQLAPSYVLHMGGRAPHKNTLALLAAWARYQTRPSLRRPDTELVVAGDGPPHAADAVPRVRFLGPVSERDLPVLYSGADLFASPSLVEGFGLTVLEAMACGAPVLCGEGDALKEVAGAAAHGVDASDPAALASALRDLVENEGRRQELASRGLRRAAQFRWSDAARSVRSIYHEVARK